MSDDVWLPAITAAADALTAWDADHGYDLDDRAGDIAWVAVMAALPIIREQLAVMMKDIDPMVFFSPWYMQDEAARVVRGEE